jgi:hypothetical protein
MIALHMGGIPETAMFLGPILLIIAFLRIARHNDSQPPTDEDDWNADLGDLGDEPAADDGCEVRTGQPVEGRVSGATPSSS